MERKKNNNKETDVKKQNKYKETDRQMERKREFRE